MAEPAVSNNIPVNSINYTSKVRRDASLINAVLVKSVPSFQDLDSSKLIKFLDDLKGVGTSPNTAYNLLMQSVSKYKEDTIDASVNELKIIADALANCDAKLFTVVNSKLVIDSEEIDGLDSGGSGAVAKLAVASKQETFDEFLKFLEGSGPPTPVVVRNAGFGELDLDVLERLRSGDLNIRDFQKLTPKITNLFEWDEKSGLTPDNMSDVQKIDILNALAKTGRFGGTQTETISRKFNDLAFGPAGSDPMIGTKKAIFYIWSDYVLDSLDGEQEPTLTKNANKYMNAKSFGAPIGKTAAESAANVAGKLGCVTDAQLIGLSGEFATKFDATKFIPIKFTITSSPATVVKLLVEAGVIKLLVDSKEIMTIDPNDWNNLNKFLGKAENKDYDKQHWFLLRLETLLGKAVKKTAPAGKVAAATSVGRPPANPTGKLELAKDLPPLIAGMEVEIKDLIGSGTVTHYNLGNGAVAIGDSITIPNVGKGLKLFNGSVQTVQEQGKQAQRFVTDDTLGVSATDAFPDDAAFKKLIASDMGTAHNVGLYLEANPDLITKDNIGEYLGLTQGKPEVFSALLKKYPEFIKDKIADMDINNWGSASIALLTNSVVADKTSLDIMADKIAELPKAELLEVLSNSALVSAIAKSEKGTTAIFAFAKNINIDADVAAFKAVVSTYIKQLTEASKTKFMSEIATYLNNSGTVVNKGYLELLKQLGVEEQLAVSDKNYISLIKKYPEEMSIVFNSNDELDNKANLIIAGLKDANQTELAVLLSKIPKDRPWVSAMSGSKIKLDGWKFDKAKNQCSFDYGGNSITVAKGTVLYAIQGNVKPIDSVKKPAADPNIQQLSFADSYQQLEPFSFDLSDTKANALEDMSFQGNQHSSPFQRMMLGRTPLSIDSWLNSGTNTNVDAVDINEANTNDTSKIIHSNNQFSATQMPESNLDTNNIITSKNNSE